MKTNSKLHCKRFNCDLTKTVCIKRQELAHEKNLRPSQGMNGQNIYHACFDCEQGLKIALKSGKHFPSTKDRKKTFLCKIEGCIGKVDSLGMCAMHYQRKRMGNIPMDAPKYTQSEKALKGVKARKNSRRKKGEKRSPRVPRSA